MRSLWFHAGAFYAFALPSNLPTIEACLQGAALSISVLPASKDPLKAGALAKPAWVLMRAAAVAAPGRYEPPPLTPLVRAGQWVTAMLESSSVAGPADNAGLLLLVPGVRRAEAVGDGAAAGAATLVLPPGRAGGDGEEPMPAPLFALFADDLVSLGGDVWLGLEEVALPTGGVDASGPGARRLVGRLKKKKAERARTCPAFPFSPSLPSIILFNPPTGRLGGATDLAAALASTADLAGLSFRVVTGEEAGGEGGGTSSDAPPPTPLPALHALASTLAHARLIVGRGGADLAAVAAAAPAGASLLELTPVEPHPAVAAVVAARAAGGPGTALASHSLWSPHPPGGAVGTHLAWADPGEGRRYGGWARPDCAVAALHGAECASAAARATLVVGGRDGENGAQLSLASLVDAALRGVHAAEGVAGVGLM